MKRLHLRMCAITLSLIPLTIGCGGSSATTPAPQTGSAEFTFETTNEFELDVHVLVDGLPASGARVSVADRIPPPPWDQAVESLSSGPAHFSGVTSLDGHARGWVQLPSAKQKVDLIVQLPDARATYTIPELELAWGPFAPSTRRTVTVQELEATVIQLQGN